MLYLSSAWGRGSLEGNKGEKKKKKKKEIRQKKRKIKKITCEPTFCLQVLVGSDGKTVAIHGLEVGGKKKKHKRKNRILTP